MQSQPATLHMTVQIKRAATGQVETHELIGTGLTVEQCQAAGIAEQPKEQPE